MPTDEGAKTGPERPERGSIATLGCLLAILLVMVLGGIFLVTQLGGG